MGFWRVFFFQTRPPSYLTQVAPSAVSLLRHLLDELLGHRLPMPDVPRIYWCARTLPKPTVTLLANVDNTATGILSLYERLGQGDLTGSSELGYFSISLSLNVILTLMIIARLALHSRNFRKAIGASSGAGGLYTSVITMLVESSALYAICYILYIIPTATGSYIGYIFAPVLGEIQVRALFAFSRCAAFSGHCLITEVNRSSLRSSSF